VAGSGWNHPLWPSKTRMWMSDNYEKRKPCYSARKKKTSRGNRVRRSSQRERRGPLEKRNPKSPRKGNKKRSPKNCPASEWMRKVQTQTTLTSKKGPRYLTRKSPRGGQAEMKQYGKKVLLVVHDHIFGTRKVKKGAKQECSQGEKKQGLSV